MSNEEIAQLVFYGVIAAGVISGCYIMVDKLGRWWRRTKRTWSQRWRSIKTVAYWVTLPIWGPIVLGRWAHQRFSEPARPEVIERGTKDQGLRQHVFRRDGNMCQIQVCCEGTYVGEEGNPLDLHHWLPFSKYPWLDMCAWNLVLCCRRCNLELLDDVPPVARDWEKGGIVICSSDEMMRRRFRRSDWTKAA